MIRKIGELGWKPFHWIPTPSNSVKGVLEPAGFDHAKSLVTTLVYKSPTDTLDLHAQFLAFLVLCLGVVQPLPRPRSMQAPSGSRGPPRSISYRGSPSPWVAMRLRWISFVPMEMTHISE